MIETLTNWLESILPGITTLTVTSIPVLAGMALFCILFCIFGYRLFKVLIGIWSAALGAFVGMEIASIFTATWWIWVIAAVVGAVLICLAALFLNYVSTFLTIGVPVAVLAAGLLVTWFPELTGLVTCLCAIGAGVLFGLLAAFLDKPIIILCSSICGAFGTVSAVWMLCASLSELNGVVERVFGTGKLGIVQYIATGGLALVGIIVQCATTAGFNRRKEK